MTIKEALNQGKTILKSKEDGSLISKMLLGYILELSKEELIVNSNVNLSEEQKEKFLKGIELVLNGYPVQYITKTREFMGLSFYVDENVLIPRPDTEVLVENIMSISKEYNKSDILELCTGSGAIAVSLAKYLDNINITATDISSKALEVAKKNANSLLENTKIKFIQSDMFKNITERYDIIISNPPYIKTKVIDEYNLEYEPKLALDGGKDGLEFYRIIINEGYKYLKQDGIIAIEIGYDQRCEVMNLAQNSGRYKECNCIKDLCGNDRVIIIK